MANRNRSHSPLSVHRPLLDREDTYDGSGYYSDEDDVADAYDDSQNSSVFARLARTINWPLIRARYHAAQRRTQAFLESSWQHYIVLALVSADLASIFIDLFISLYACEQHGNKAGPVLGTVQEVCSIAGLVFSCLFMVELTANVWATGPGYFRSWFHWIDSTVIIIAFVVDVILKGLLEEVASLVVVLRLWRFVKIIEEFSVGAEEQMEGLERRIEELENENEDLKRQLRGSLRSRKPSDEEEALGGGADEE